MTSAEKTRGRVEEDDDDWETDPDYVATMTEEEQRWGGQRDTGAIDMDRLRAEVSWKQDRWYNNVKLQACQGAFYLVASTYPVLKVWMILSLAFFPT